METGDYNLLIKNIDPNYHQRDFTDAIIPEIEDRYYYDFMRQSNGGLFFSRALQLYTTDEFKGLHTIKAINKVIIDSYDKMLEGFYYFGCDVFGNQFGYFENKIYFTTIETGESEYLADNFKTFINRLKSELDYFTGRPIAEAFQLENGLLELNYRLNPVKPFIIGGEFDPANLYQMQLDKIISLNSKLAKTTRNLPDGTRLTIKSPNT